MDEIRVKDVIFSFRHIYLDNLRKLNKRLKKHISINSHLINDVVLYCKSDEYSKGKINVKYKMNNGSLGSIILDVSEALLLDSFLRNEPEITKDEDGRYVIDDNRGISIKDSKIDREMECVFKEDFYKNITSSFNSSDMNVSFNGYEITISTKEFIVCYNCVGDLIYSYSHKPMGMNDILNTIITVDINDEFHGKIVKKQKKTVDNITRDSVEEFPGDYFIKEHENRYTLKKIKNGKLSRYI